MSNANVASVTNTEKNKQTDRQTFQTKRVWSPQPVTIISKLKYQTSLLDFYFLYLLVFKINH